MNTPKRALIVAIGLSVTIAVTTLLDSNINSLAIEVDNKALQWIDPVPENNSTGIYSTPMEYAKLIESELGIPPVVDCGENIEIPIYIDGEKFEGNPGIHGCDNPSLQVGDCMSGSSLGRYPGVTADGQPMPHVVWVSYCRHEGRPGAMQYKHKNSVQMIGYNSETGATAFYESGGMNGDLTYTDPKNNRMMGKMPGIDDPEAFNKAYSTPGTIQCVQCHQNDPFVHNPYIDSARLPSDPEQPVIPRNRGSDEEFEIPYYIIGASDWDMRTIHIEGNKCLKCHRIGMKTVEEFIGDRWNPNDHMPPQNPGSLSEHFQELVDCWEAGPDETPGCDWIIPPAGDTLGQVVGDEYPYKAAYNSPNTAIYDSSVFGNKDDEDDDEDDE